MCCCVCWFVFFFFKQKTAYEMRISDWSSDVCSSDLDPAGPPLGWGQALRQRQAWYFVAAKFFTDPVWYLFLFWLPDFFARTQGLEIGRASCRERVCQYV